MACKATPQPGLKVWFCCVFLLTCIVSPGESSTWGMSNQMCTDPCSLTLVESIPDNLTYPAGAPVHPSTYDGLLSLINSAKQSIELASFYWSLHGSDTSYHDDSDWQGESLFQKLLKAGRDRKIKIKIAQNSPQTSNDTKELAQSAGAEVRSLNITRLIGNGILQTKMWLIDRQHFYVGSANFDWRSLRQIKELGVVVKFNSTPGTSFLSSSLPRFCAMGRTVDTHAIVSIIREAKEFVHISVMDYSPTTEFMYPREYWPVIDDEIRKAAFRGVEVKLLGSYWLHTHNDMITYMESLSILSTSPRPLMDCHVKLFIVPAYTPSQSKIPFARVMHNRYMVTDRTAYIGTTNWSGDSYINTAGIGFVVNQPGSSTAGNSREQLEKIFLRDWYSEYAHTIPQLKKQLSQQ
ncbi:hypothetical protein ScPMuIL_014223 [Solemya velum]